MPDKGRITCNVCGADLGPSGCPDDTNMDDMCEGCLRSKMAKDSEGRRASEVVDFVKASVPCQIDSRVLALINGLEAKIDEVLKDILLRLATLERWADRRE